MGAALRVVDIIAEAQHIFMKLVNILESHLHGNAFALSLEIDHVEDKYERGNPVTELVNGLLPVRGKTRESGTTINFLPDDTIFDKTRFKEDEVKSRLHETAYSFSFKMPSSLA